MLPAEVVGCATLVDKFVEPVVTFSNLPFWGRFIFFILVWTSKSAQPKMDTRTFSGM